MLNINRTKTRVLIGLVFLLSLLIVFSLKNDSDSLEISEICAHNQNITYDYYGNYTDYVELYNATKNDILLSNYYLSDDKDNLKKYNLPKEHIQPREYKTIYIDKEYSTFSISDNEDIYLSNNNNRIIDCVHIGKSKINEAYGKNKSGKFVLCIPTPDAENIFESKQEKYPSITLATPIASIESGFYDEPFYLELISSENNDIYYTLDSTEPTTESLKYETPIYIYDKSNDPNVYSVCSRFKASEDEYYPEDSIKKSTIIRAVSIDNKGNKSEELFLTYFVGIKGIEGYDTLPTISLIANPEDLFDYEKGIYTRGKVFDMYKHPDREYDDKTFPANYNSTGSNWKRNALINYFDENGELKDAFKAIIGIHGNYSTAENQKSFNIFSVENNDFFNIFDIKHDSLVIKNGGNDCKRTKIRDVVNQTLVKGRGIGIQSFKQVQLFLDGEYWGIYTLQDRIEKRLISEIYGVDKESIALIKSGKLVDSDIEDDYGFSELMSYISSNDMSIEENYNYVLKKMNMSSFIDYVAINMYLANSDYYINTRNNYVVWRDISNDDSKWNWALYDTDCTASIYGDVSNVDPFISSDNGKALMNDNVFASLIKNDDFKKDFIYSVLDIANYYYNYEKVSNLTNNISSSIASSMIKTQKRFEDGEYTIDEYKERLDVYKSFFENRFDYISNCIKNDFDINENLVKVTVINNSNDVIRFNTLSFDDSGYNGRYFNKMLLKLGKDSDELKWYINRELYSDDKEIEIVPNNDLLIELK